MPAAQRDATVRAVARFFPDASPLAREPVLRRYVTDLTEPYGVALDEAALAAGRGHSYGEMGEVLLADVVAEGREVDLLILAHAIPDVRPGRSTALYLSSVSPGRPHAFAVTDQGIAAPYTAIRLAQSFLDSGECRNALIMILEQSELYHEPFGTVDLPERHAGVALWLEPGDAAVRQHTSVTRDEALRLLPPAPRLILGGGLREGAAQPMTRAWAEYAKESGSAVVADYDADMRTLSICALGAGAEFDAGSGAEAAG